jgi:hypothetical protein
MKECLIKMELLEKKSYLKQKFVIFKFGHFWILINVQNKKTQQNVQNAFFQKTRFYVFQNQQHNWCHNCSCKKVEKKYFYFLKKCYSDFWTFIF